MSQSFWHVLPSPDRNTSYQTLKGGLVEGRLSCEAQTGSPAWIRSKHLHENEVRVLEV